MSRMTRELTKSPFNCAQQRFHCIIN